MKEHHTVTERIGRTKTVVFVHGFTGLPASWDRVIAELGLSLVADPWLPTLPGHGGEPVPEGLTLSGLGETWGRALLGRGGAPACWVGYSMGARVCCAVASQVPEAVAGLVLVGVHPGFADDDTDGRAARRETELRWARCLRDRGLEAFNRAWAAQPLFASQAALPESVRAERRAIRSAHQAEPLARALVALGTSRMADHRPAVQGLTVPVVLVTGGLDHKFDTIARAWVEQAPRLQHHRIHGSGHDPTLERPEALALVLKDVVGAAATSSD